MAKKEIYTFSIFYVSDVQRYWCRKVFNPNDTDKDEMIANLRGFGHTPEEAFFDWVEHMKNIYEQEKV
jgi:hypothetical protein